MLIKRIQLQSPFVPVRQVLVEKIRKGTPKHLIRDKVSLLVTINQLVVKYLSQYLQEVWLEVYIFNNQQFALLKDGQGFCFYIMIEGCQWSNLSRVLYDNILSDCNRISAITCDCSPGCKSVHGTDEFISRVLSDFWNYKDNKKLRTENFNDSAYVTNRISRWVDEVPDTNEWFNDEVYLQYFIDHAKRHKPSAALTHIESYLEDKYPDRQIKKYNKLTSYYANKRTHNI